MKTATLLSATALSAQLAAAQLWECNAYRRPNWGDCSRITEPWRDSEDILHEHDPGNCLVWYDGNCEVAHCFRPDEGEGSITKSYAHNVAGELNYRCANLRAGGQWNSGADYLEIYNAEGQGAARKRSPVPDNTPLKMTIEEWEELKNDTGINRGDFEKRQVDGDDVVSIDFVARGIRHESEFERGPRLSSGAGYHYETENSRTFSVTTSITLGGGWNIFTAEVGTEISQSDSFSIREGLTFDVNCADQGQVTFYPFYDRYDVTYWPSGTQATIWIPAAVGDYQINGEIAIACQG